jgi:hypothetical protein
MARHRIATIVHAWDQVWEAVREAGLTERGDRQVSESVESLRQKWKRPTIEQILALADIIRRLGRDFD